MPWVNVELRCSLLQSKASEKLREEGGERHGHVVEIEHIPVQPSAHKSRTEQSPCPVVAKSQMFLSIIKLLCTRLTRLRWVPLSTGRTGSNSWQTTGNIKHKPIQALSAGRAQDLNMS